MVDVDEKCWNECLFYDFHSFSSYGGNGPLGRGGDHSRKIMSWNFLVLIIPPSVEWMYTSIMWFNFYLHTVIRLVEKDRDVAPFFLENFMLRPADFRKFPSFCLSRCKSSSPRRCYVEVSYCVGVLRKYKLKITWKYKEKKFLHLR